jgi:hypothetical protein
MEPAWITTFATSMVGSSDGNGFIIDEPTTISAADDYKPIDSVDRNFAFGEPATISFGNDYESVDPTHKTIDTASLKRDTAPSIFPNNVVHALPGKGRDAVLTKSGAGAPPWVLEALREGKQAPYSNPKSLVDALISGLPLEPLMPNIIRWLANQHTPLAIFLCKYLRGCIAAFRVVTRVSILRPKAGPDD